MRTWHFTVLPHHEWEHESTAFLLGGTAQQSPGDAAQTRAQFSSFTPILTPEAFGQMQVLICTPNSCMFLWKKKASQEESQCRCVAFFGIPSFHLVVGFHCSFLVNYYQLSRLLHLLLMLFTTSASNSFCKKHWLMQKVRTSSLPHLPLNSFLNLFNALSVAMVSVVITPLSPAGAAE